MVSCYAEPKGNTLHSVKLLIKTENECQRTRLPDRTRVVNNFLCAGSDFGDACIVRFPIDLNFINIQYISMSSLIHA